MRSGDDERALAAYKLFFDNFSLRAVKELTIQSLFNFRVAARNRIANHDAIRRGT